ncbi:putative multidrug resistance ABC transporter ATP-binding/permease protein YheH [Planococcus massiliensis]|uniref:Putative multidrug resistance ABC transporter ATP-binding/permease protein YheH n=1 Tax=Planococcus massiliensis TaxID=1499687 RepID=A0A098EM85_9BACL|nr:ABC transporter transmembrane domain-containing protein [Planococcus massiliensis]CEG22895.1 putative multidrug resistance ABC transporter ATP-binding/permease protein YheH [Planococcus massiliensis]
MEKQPTLTGKDQWTVFKRLLTYLIPHKKMLAFAMLLLVLTVLGDVLGPFLIKTFIDDFLTPGNFPTGPVVGLAVGYLFIQISNVVISYFQLLKFQEAALKIIQQMRIDVFAKVQNLGMRYFDKTPAGSIVSRVTNDTEAIKEMFVSVLIGFIQSAFLIIGVYIAMFFLNVKLAAISLVLLPILFWIMYLYRKYSSVFYQDLRERLGQLNAKISESVQGMGMIQAFGQEERLKDEFSGINEQHWQAGKRNIKIDGLLLRPAIDLVYALALIILLSYFGITSFSNTVEVGVIYAFVTYIDRFFEPINQVMQRLSIFQQAIVAAARVFSLLDEDDLAPAQNSTAGTIEDGRIEFKGVSFSYDGTTDVLKNISFTAMPGETVALVGHTGSGKSSIINLLMRFYEFSKGDILIDGKSVKNYESQELRKKIGLVLQDPFLFYGSIESNIRLHNQKMTDAEVQEAAEFVQADRFIHALPNGYRQDVTERGSTFSSGQRQLVAFARTMATNPKILVLDEATANIDTETEIAIQAGLERMRKGRTTIAIAHRLSTIQDADQILVLHHGEIVERGTHQELLAERGLYHKMYLLQNGIVETM